MATGQANVNIRLFKREHSRRLNVFCMADLALCSSTLTEADGQLSIRKITVWH